MRKRRRLANKMTIMVCAVLIAVSAFFYAPMEVSANESLRSSIDFVAVASDEDLLGLSDSMSSITEGGGQFYTARSSVNFPNFTLIDNLDDNLLYKINLNYDLLYEFTSDSSVLLRDLFVSCGGKRFINLSSPNTFERYSFARFNGSANVLLYGKDIKSGNLSISSRFLKSTAGSLEYVFSYNFYDISYSAITGEDSVSYQQGYNAGYSAGEEAGESNGYSSGYSDGYEVGEQSGYDSGFQAGSDSVDTQSYYDAGYSAGYDAGYLSGYDTGYDEGYDAGWSAYEAQMDKWGADTSDYPVLKYSFFKDRLRLICDVFTSAPSTSYDSALLCYLDFDVNPNHTYKFVVSSGGASGGTSDALYSNFKLNFVIGSNVINATNNVGKTFDFFIPGYNMGSSILFEAFVYDCVYYGGLSEEDGFLKHMGQVYPTLIDCYIDIYDMGPSGDTQNHIANQTDQLTNGYDDSKGNTVNSDLSTGLNDYETAENSLFATATTGMRDFTFFDFESVPAMLTAVTFITSIMGSWFEQAGGASGVGIVLSILFSVMLVSMVLGLYRLYQSAGHRAEARERHRERMEQWKRGK